jgi:hypothetical protein
MQTKSIISLFIAAVGINAAPSVLPRADSVPISVYDGPGCNNNPVPLTTANVPTDGQCFGISPIVAGNVDSFRIESSAYTVPAGCNSKSYRNLKWEEMVDHCLFSHRLRRFRLQERKLHYYQAIRTVLYLRPG